MSDSYVCSGATMRCTMGTNQARLTVLPIRVTYLTGQPMANISDHASFVNLAPFGRCRSLGFPATAAATAAHHGHLTPMPCVHNTPFPWMGGKNDYLVQNQPALLKTSCCQCMWGGTISLVTDGQTDTGPADMSKQSKETFERNQVKSKKAPRIAAKSNRPTLSDTKKTSMENGLSDFANQSNLGAKITQATQKAVETLKVEIPMNMAEFVLASTWKNYSEEEKKHIVSMANELPGKLNATERLKKAENCLALEKALGQKKGPPMTTENADKQNANPNHTYKYIRDPNGTEIIDGVKASVNPNYDEQYSINCATCSAAYALRKSGFDVTAKGNTPDTRNEWLSQGHSFDIWNNADGTKAQPTLVNEWMKKNKIEKMTGDDYTKFYDENCKEEGIYVVTVKWKETEVVDAQGKKTLVSNGAHATILQREPDGKLYYIEPQVYNSSKGADGRRSLNNLIYNSDGNLNLSPTPPSNKGVMRVDNKLFNTDYVDLFNTK